MCALEGLRSVQISNRINGSSNSHSGLVWQLSCALRQFGKMVKKMVNGNLFTHIAPKSSKNLFICVHVHSRSN